MFNFVRQMAEDARLRGVCVRCQEPALVRIDGVLQHNPELFHSLAGKKEWDISAMCEKCFDNMILDMYAPNKE